MLTILVVIAVIFWGLPVLKREKPSKGGSLAASPAPPPGSAGGRRRFASGCREHHGTSTNHLDAPPSLEWYWHDRRQDAREGMAGHAEHHGGRRHHLHASPNLEWYGPGGQHENRHKDVRKERYGEPPGMLRAVHQDELGFRGWADMPGDYEGSSASAISAYIQRSA